MKLLNLGLGLTILIGLTTVAQEISPQTPKPSVSQPAKAQQPIPVSIPFGDVKVILNNGRSKSGEKIVAMSEQEITIEDEGIKDKINVNQINLIELKGDKINWPTSTSTLVIRGDKLEEGDISIFRIQKNGLILDQNGQGNGYISAEFVIDINGKPGIDIDIVRGASNNRRRYIIEKIEFEDFKDKVKIMKITATVNTRTN